VELFDLGGQVERGPAYVRAGVTAAVDSLPNARSRSGHIIFGYNAEVTIPVILDVAKRAMLPDFQRIGRPYGCWV
jgi:hypothetical protein